MEYIALHYVKIAGRVYTPGEIIDETFDGAERLLRLGAIEACGKAPAIKSEAEPFKAEAEDIKPSPALEAHEETEEASEETEVPMSIDVSEGLVEAVKPAKKKSGGRKRA